MTYLYLKSKLMLRSPLVMGLILLSLLLGVVGGFVVNTYESRQTSYSIGIVDIDQTSASSDLIEALEKHPSLSVHLYTDKKSANKALSNKDILQTYVILEGFQEAIFSGKYHHIVEAVSMVKSPFSPWLNDQVSVSVIREWIISDGYGRMLSVNPDYSRAVFVDAFDAYGRENELLSFTVIESDASIVTVEDRSLPLYMQAILWSWCGVILLFSLIFMRQLYIEKHMNICRRHLLSGIKPCYYHGVYIGLFILMVILGVSLFTLGFSVVSRGLSALFSRLVLASIFLSISFYISVWLLGKLKLNLKQLVLVYLGVVMTWSLLTIEAIGIFEIGKFLHYLSPLTLFFKICS